MPGEDRDHFLARSLKSFQDSVSRAGPAASASYTLVGAILLMGGVGYAVDVWQGTSPWGVLCGLCVGMVIGFYELARAVWRR